MKVGKLNEEVDMLKKNLGHNIEEPFEHK